MLPSTCRISQVDGNRGTALGGGDDSRLADKLRELQTARDEGFLTESEFQAARQNAIASLTNGSSDVAPFVSQQRTTGPAAAAEQSAPVVPIPMEQGQNGPRESRETARATIRAEQMARQGHEEVRNFYVVWTNH